jgi:epoxyqueuosine reductase
MSVIDRLADWLEQEVGTRTYKLPYHIEHGAVYMKDAAVLAGLGCIGKNNLLITPSFGPRQRLRVLLIDVDLPPTGPMEFDPCRTCPMPCRAACPQKAFDEKTYSCKAFGLPQLPGRNGAFNRQRCNRQMDADNAACEIIEIQGQLKPERRVKYCRACELACPVGLP